MLPTDIRTVCYSVISLVISHVCYFIKCGFYFQALTKQLAEILDFSLKFDDLKVHSEHLWC